MAALREHGVAVDAISSLYETEPVGEVLSQPDFYNAVVAVETDLAPRDLLAACKQIEQDIPIWENKIYVHPPVLVDGDGPIGLFRRWAKQFYAGAPEASAPLAQAF